MARTVASLPAGSRITDYISLGVLTKTFPLDKVIAVVAAAGKTSQRATGFARARGRLLRPRVDAVHAGLVSRSAALLAGRCQVVTGTGVGSEGGRQVRNFAGAHQTGMGTAEATP